MSKRWKVRVRNAAKLERSREVMAQFAENVEKCFEQAKNLSPEVIYAWKRSADLEEKYGCDVNPARIIGYNKS